MGKTLSTILQLFCLVTWDMALAVRKGSNDFAEKCDDHYSSFPMPKDSDDIGVTDGSQRHQYGVEQSQPMLIYDASITRWRRPLIQPSASTIGGGKLGWDNSRDLESDVVSEDLELFINRKISQSSK